MTTTHQHPPVVALEIPVAAPTRVELVTVITDFCLDLIQQCDGHTFIKGSPALDILAMYAYGAIHTLADRHRLGSYDRHMLGTKLFYEFFGQDVRLALANACALAGAAQHEHSPRYAVIQSSAAAFRDWQRDPSLLDGTDFRAYLPWPDAA